MNKLSSLINIKKTIVAVAIIPTLLLATLAYARKPLDEFRAHPPIHIHRTASVSVGLSPTQIKTVYNLPTSGGSDTIAIIDAYDDPYVESDLNVFSQNYGLPSCTSSNGCFEKYMMVSRIRGNTGWGLEESLDVEWAHAIAPSAKILLVEAKSNSGTDLLAAIDYARQRADVVAVSMSWGGNEFSGESSYDSHFTSPYGTTFFASAGDSGTGVQWPAVSQNVTGVGGTTLNFTNGSLSSETAWSGSGGGLSVYELEPVYQSTYQVPNANSMRAVPDVSYDADPNSGVSVYDSFGYNGWLEVGGTSVGAPQWAAIKSFGGNAINSQFYSAASSTTYAAYFRDITSGTNGTCGFYCTAQTGYDYVTGLGSPLTTVYLLGTLSAEDFGVMNFSGVKGYTAGFGLTDATFKGVQSVVMKLYAGNILLQTNTATAKVGADITGTQISSPFDVFGTFDYAADGYWTNVRGVEYGQTLVPTRVVATVILANGKVLTAENTNLTGDTTILFSVLAPTPTVALATIAGQAVTVGSIATFTVNAKQQLKNNKRSA